MNKEELVKKIMELSMHSEDRILIAIDGRSCSGKTTLAGYLSERIDTEVFHADDFFLRAEQRTEARLSEPGGNFDRERFDAQVLTPLTEGRKSISYQKFDCHTMSLLPPTNIVCKKINIIEGAYCCHPDLAGKYDLKLFLDISKEEQKERIMQRNGEKQWEIFRDRWIPMEEKYFKTFHIKENCDLLYDDFMTRPNMSVNTKLT